MLSWKNQRDRHSHGLNALEQLALQGDYNATLSHNLTEAKLILYETQPKRILKSNAFRSALHSTRRLIANLPHLQQQAEHPWQQQQLLNLQRMLSEARINALAAAEKNDDAREVLMLLSKFLGVSALGEVGGVLSADAARQSSASMARDDQGVPDGGSAPSGAQMVGAAVQRGWQAVQSAGVASVHNMRTMLDRRREASNSAHDVQPFQTQQHDHAPHASYVSPGHSAHSGVQRAVPEQLPLPPPPPPRPLSSSLLDNSTTKVSGQTLMSACPAIL